MKRQKQSLNLRIIKNDFQKKEQGFKKTFEDTENLKYYWKMM